MIKFERVRLHVVERRSDGNLEEEEKGPARSSIQVLDAIQTKNIRQQRVELKATSLWQKERNIIMYNFAEFTRRPK